MKARVPRAIVLLVGPVSSAIFWSTAARTVAMPKSPIFTCPVRAMRMFAGLTSRWTTRLRWA